MSPDAEGRLARFDKGYALLILIVLLAIGNLSVVIGSRPAGPDRDALLALEQELRHVSSRQDEIAERIEALGSRLEERSPAPAGVIRREALGDPEVGVNSGDASNDRLEELRRMLEALQSDMHRLTAGAEKPPDFRPLNVAEVEMALASIINDSDARKRFFLWSPQAVHARFGTPSSAMTSGTTTVWWYELRPGRRLEFRFNDAVVTGVRLRYRD